MFSYSLRGGLFTRTYYEDEKIKFDPPVYEQRYSTTTRIIEDQRWCRHFKKIVEFGCAEMKLLPLLRRIETIEHIIAVDIDGLLLDLNKQIAKPLISDHLNKRPNPLRIEIFEGNITASVENLRNVDVVIGLEIIEHLHEDVLEQVPANVFGFIQPKLAIFSTPNSDFNHLFGPLLANGFRHFDHKFEWTRDEFKAWSLDICQKYPNYKVSIIGVGDPPEAHINCGHVSQIAIFARLDILDEELAQPLEEKAANLSPSVQYKEIFTVDYPFHRDERTKEQKIIDEANYVVQIGRYVERYLNEERHVREIPINTVFEMGEQLNLEKAEVLRILKNENFEILNDFVIMPEDNDDFDGKDDDEDNDEYLGYNANDDSEYEYRQRFDDLNDDVNDWQPYEDIDDEDD